MADNINSISLYYKKLQQLTAENLSMLKALNESFHTNSAKVAITLNDSVYNIPSFLALSNRLSALEDSFQNLVDAPRTGTAAFDFGGSTQKIIMDSYAVSPAKPQPVLKDSAFIAGADFFKDIMMPSICVKFDISSSPFNSFCVRRLKVTGTDAAADVDAALAETSAGSMSWDRFMAVLALRKEGTDYSWYDKQYSRDTVSDNESGDYTIKEIKTDSVDNSTLDEYITVSLDSITVHSASLTDRNLVAGDRLITADGRCAFTLTTVSGSVVTMLVDDGYKSLSAGDGLRFYSPAYRESGRTVTVPVDTDAKSYWFVSAVNTGADVRSVFSDSITVDPAGMTVTVDGQSVNLASYIKENADNISVKLQAVTEFDTYMNEVPASTISAVNAYKDSTFATSAELLKSNAKVVLLNTHLQNQSDVQKLKNLNSTKSQLALDMSSLDTSIKNIQSQLSANPANSVSLKAQLSQLTTQKLDKTNQWISTVESINTLITSNISEFSPKYRVRGYIPYGDDKNGYKAGIESAYGIPAAGFELQYKYAATGTDNTTSDTVGDVQFDSWNSVYTPRRKSGDKGKALWADFDKKDFSSVFTAFDIPISKGEKVSIRYRYRSALGWPFAAVWTDWSSAILEVPFDDSLTVNSDITNIVESNAEELKNAEFTKILINNGYYEHNSDGDTSAGKRYYHKADNIESGFLSAEQNIISLKDKLYDLSSQIAVLNNSIDDTDNMQVTIDDGEVEQTCKEDNMITYQAKSVMAMTEKIDYVIYKNLYYFSKLSLNINIKNTSDKKTLRLYSIFPGSSDTTLTASKYFVDDVKYFSHADIQTAQYAYTFSGDKLNTELAVVKDVDPNNPHVNFKQYISYLNEGNISGKEQYLGQFIYFNNNSIFTKSDSWYFTENKSSLNCNIFGVINKDEDEYAGNLAYSKYDLTYNNKKSLPYYNNYNVFNVMSNNGAFPNTADFTLGGPEIYYMGNNENSFSIGNQTEISYKELLPKQKIVIPVQVYCVSNQDNPLNTMRLSFCLKEHVGQNYKNFIIDVNQNFQKTAQDVSRKSNVNAIYTPVII